MNKERYSKRLRAGQPMGKFLDLIIGSITTIPLILASSNCFAESPEMQAQALQEIFVNFCVENIENLDNLKSSLKNSSLLPPEQAKKYLGLRAGSSWVVPNEQGLFVLSIPETQDACHVTARRADPHVAERLFIKFVSSAPPLYSAKKTADFNTELDGAGNTHSVGYAWVSGNSTKKIIFALTASEHEIADIQAIAYVKISSKQ